MRATVMEKREVARGTVLVVFDAGEREELKQAGVPEEQILPDRFSGY